MNEELSHFHLPGGAGPEQLLGLIIQDFMQFLRHSGLSGPQIHALLHIFHSGECRVSEISMLSDSSPAAASQLVDRLVQQGLVERREDPSNRRVKLVRLTDKGQQLIRRGVSSNRFLGQLMEELSPEQRKTVHAAFGYLAQAAQKIHSPHKRKAKTNASDA